MLLILLLIGVIYLGTLFTAPALQKAGVPASKTYIPFVNTMELVKATGRPIYQAFVVYLPIFNFFLLFSFFTDLSRSFGKDSFGDYFKAMVWTPFHFWKASKNEYRGKTTELPKQRKSIVREWGDSIVFAVLAATLIRWSSFEAFMIPTSSMDSTLKVGDYLFVSKLHYGPRSPITPLQIPLTHQNIWFTGNPDGTNGVASYLDWIKLPYFRLPGLTEIKRNDIVVFNWPWDNGKDVTPGIKDRIIKSRLRPTDLKTNYVKRCVAIPGDTLRVVGDNITINNKISKIDGIIQFKYLLTIDSLVVDKKFGGKTPRAVRAQFDPRTGQAAFVNRKLLVTNPTKFQQYCENLTSILDDQGVRTEQSMIAGSFRKPDFQQSPYGFDLLNFSANLTTEQYKELSKNKLFKSIERVDYKRGSSNTGLYPMEKAWNQNDYGPLVMPKRGMKFKVTKERLIQWERALTYFEGDEVKIKKNYSELWVDGKKVSEYTFKQNYYFMIGDNRNGSYDSRYWAFVPEDHVVGTPLLVWMSVDDTPGKGIRWNRIFKYVR